ncbi:hypothetical protein C8Q70DRAFT_564457 [Cubamyces menziesii]|nr:hypothetical protein C8Q70DRAFT_564457 [Cubamyces menziesii]
MEVNITSRDPVHARSWQQITSASVFEKGESSEDIRRDICLLTTMMATHNDEPTRLATGAGREDIDRYTGQLQRLCHISALLNIGGRSNEAVGTAKIMSAQMEAECATLVCAYTERLNVPREQTEPKAYEEIVPIEGHGQQLLENWFEARGSDVDTVPADQHLIDVVAIMHYLRSITDPVALSANTFALSKFITCRARYQLASRLRSLFGTKLWTENPLTIVKEWFSNVDPSVQPEPRYLAVNPQAEPLFARYDLFPSPAGRGIPLSLANVLQWVAALEGIIDDHGQFRNVMS